MPLFSACGALVEVFKQTPPGIFKYCSFGGFLGIKTGKRDD